MITIKEEFRRDGLAANFLADGKLINLFLKAFPGSKVNVGYPLICKEESKSCKQILKYNEKMSEEMYLAGHARKDHVDAMIKIIKSISKASGGVWIPISKGFNKRTIKLSYSDLKKRISGLVDYWHQNTKSKLTIALADCTAKEKGILFKIEDMTKFLLKKGVTKVIICDTLGKGTPKQIKKIFVRLKKFSHSLEFHAHNDNGMALKNIQLAINCGVKDISTAIYNSGERNNMVDPRELIPYGLKYNSKEFIKFEKYYKKIIGNPKKISKLVFGKGVIVTGTQHRLRKLDAKLVKTFGVTSDTKIASDLFKCPISSTKLSLLKDLLYKKKIICINKSNINKIKKDKDFKKILLKNYLPKVKLRIL